MDSKQNGIKINRFFEQAFPIKNKNYGNYSKGVNGTFSGKIGILIGSNWLRIDLPKTLAVTRIFKRKLCSLAHMFTLNTID